MANIKLYKIDGISLENTPYFANASDQETYLNHYIVYQPDDGFYVPRFEDRIILEIPTNVQVNYLSILFNNKYWYYFIADVKYISETTVELYIVLDSFQTFIFNLHIHDSIIERKFIDRVKRSAGSWKINRDYIRENISNGVWTEPEYNYIKLEDYGMYLFRTTDTEVGSLFSIDTFVPIWEQNGTILTDAGWIEYLITDEVFTTFDNYVYHDATGTVADYVHSIGTPALTAFRKRVVSEKMFNACYIPFIPFQDIKITEEDDGHGNITKSIVFNDAWTGTSSEAQKFEIVTDDVFQMGGIDPGGIDRTHYTSMKFKEYDRIVLVDGDALIAEESYKPEHIMQVIDDNYQSYNFGERAFVATFPLYYTENYQLHLKYSADIRSGNRMYAITDSYTDNTFSKGGVMVTSQPNGITLFSDTWLSWISQNRATMAVALANYAIQSSIMGVGRTTVKQAISSKHDYGTDNKRIRRRLPGDATARNFYTRDVKTDMYSTDKYTSVSTTSGREADPSNLIHTVGSAVNAWLAPDSIKQTSVYCEDRATGANRNVLYQLKVIDFNECAYFFHQFGYLVNVPYSFSSLYSAFTTNLMSRKYFDYYKFQYANIEVWGVLSSGDMLADLESRLTSGIRVWYVDNGPMCDYTKNNIERSLI